MSLRAKILALFLVLAALPVLGLGAFVYSRSLRAVETLVAAQNTRIAVRIAEAVEARAARLESDLLLLSENVETQRWLVAHTAGRVTEVVEAEGREFLDEVWRRVGSGYAGVQLADAAGRVLYGAGRSAESRPARTGLPPIERPIRELTSGRPLGTIRVEPILGAMLPLDVITAGFGEQSYGLVVDRANDRILYAADAAMTGRSATELLGPGFAAARTDSGRGVFQYRAEDTLRVASFAALSGMPWTVVMSGAVSEFAAPFSEVGRSTLLLFILVAVGATMVFSVSLRRATRSLEELTAATAVVGEGNFTPDLPPEGTDEIGRLTASFGTMVGRLREMMEEVRTSRQMAILGEFAAQLSHEIRNPLTSIKLNLQKLGRSADTIPRGAATSLGIALREVGRLDQVVRSVLELARQETGTREPGSVHETAREAVEVVADQARAQGVRLQMSLEASADEVMMSQVRIKGALLNLLLNALEAMPSGGELVVRSSSAAGVFRLTVSDTGPGVSAGERNSIFRPFATTKEGGTGLGLPLARRAIEEHGGSLSLEDSESGAQFAITLPLVES